MASQPEQTITALNEADQKRLRDQRVVVEQYLGDDAWLARSMIPP